MSESEQPRSAEDLVRMWAAERTRAERAEREIAETRPILLDIRDRQLPALMAWKEDALEAQQVLGLKLAQAEAEVGRLRRVLEEIAESGMQSEAGDPLAFCAYCGYDTHIDWCPCGIADAALAGQEEGKQDA